MGVLIKTHPTRRIIVVDGDMGSRESSAEVLIRHGTNSPKPSRLRSRFPQPPHQTVLQKDQAGYGHP